MQAELKDIDLRVAKSSYSPNSAELVCTRVRYKIKIKISIETRIIIIIIVGVKRTTPNNVFIGIILK